MLRLVFLASLAALGSTRAHAQSDIVISIPRTPAQRAPEPPIVHLSETPASLSREAELLRALATPPTVTSHTDEDMCIIGWTLVVLAWLGHVGLGAATGDDNLALLFPSILPGVGPFAMMAVIHDSGAQIAEGVFGGIEILGLFLAVLAELTRTITVTPAWPRPSATPKASDEQRASSVEPRVSVSPNASPSGASLTIRLEW